MILRGVDYGSTLGASGVQGFFGEGYWFHKPLHALGALNFTGMTFVSKTATLFSRKGNMPLTERYTPKNMFPSCIKVRPLRKLILNSVGLSNPGLGTLLGMGLWQEMTKPLLISIMATANSRVGRMAELRIMRDMIGLCKHDFKAPFGIQLNLSCPNVKGHKPSDIIGESEESIEILSELGVPIMPKYSIATASIEAILELNDNPNCDAICVSNTIPFGWEGIDWKKIWGSDVSPLEKLGGGGLSGDTLRVLVGRWILDLRNKGFNKPINGGGGILCPLDAEGYYVVGANSVFLGSIASLRPHQVQRTIKHANRLFGAN